MSAHLVPASLRACASVPAWPVCAGVWRASELQAPGGLAVWPSGHAALDAQLPGAGWPCGSLVEVLQIQPGHTEWQLLLPALGSWQRHSPLPGEPARVGVVLVGPPHAPVMAGLQAQGLQTASLITVNAVEPVQRLWACEQALHSPAVGAVLAWLPHAPVDALRRLQHAATRHGGLLWVFRPLQTQHQASPAPLRLRLDGWSAQGGLVVSVLKRRGPPVGHPVHLAPPGESLQAALAAARWRQALRLRPVGVPQECHEPLAPAVVGPAELVA